MSHGHHHGHGHGHGRRRSPHMDRLHKGIIAVVAVAVAGTAAWFTYDLYIRPRREIALEQRRLEKEAAAKAAEAARDPSLADFEATSGQARDAAPSAARELWAEFLRKHPGSPKAGEVRSYIGPLNSAELFSATSGPGKTVHTVASGDSLFKIAKKYGTTVELVAKANNLTNTMLQVGQQLVVPQTDMKVEVDRAGGTLVLLNRDEFFRAYPLLSSRLPALKEGSTAQCTVVENVVEAGGKKMVFGDKNYSAGRRTVVLSPPGMAVLSVPDGTPASEFPSGLVVSPSDLDEIFVLLRRGVPVTIK